jgi:hypothetical protein
MCDVCDAPLPDDGLSLNDPLVLQARNIESAMAGDCVPKSAGAVYVGAADRGHISNQYVLVSTSQSCGRSVLS